MLMPNSDGDLPLLPTGKEAAATRFWFTSRTVLSPVKTPPLTLGAPVESVLFTTRSAWRWTQKNR